MLRCGLPKRPLVHHAAFCGLKRGFVRPKHQFAALQKGLEHWRAFSLGQCSCASLPDTHWRVAVLNQWLGRGQLGRGYQKASDNRHLQQSKMVLVPPSRLEGGCGYLGRRYLKLELSVTARALGQLYLHLLMEPSPHIRPSVHVA
jgi:hypothetical protein